jgi:hypothetical protein
VAADNPSARVAVEDGVRRRSTRGVAQGGQAVTAVVVMAFGIILAVAVGGLIPLGQATDESSQANNAADAAALGGAHAIRGVLLDRLVSLPFGDLDSLGSGDVCSMGRGAAEEYAARNRATLSRYCYYAPEDRIEVEVQMRWTGLDGVAPAKARAVASVGLSFASCKRRDDPLPPMTTTTAGTSTVTALPITAPPVTMPRLPLATELRCRGAVLRFEVDPDDGRAVLVAPRSLAALLTPRLIG